MTSRGNIIGVADMSEVRNSRALEAMGMTMRIIPNCLMLVAAAASALAIAKPAAAIEIKPVDAGGAFERSAFALNHKIKAIVEKCGKGETAYICRYKVGDGVTYLAMAADDSAKATGLGLYISKPQDLRTSSMMLSVFLTTIDPEIALSERNRIVAKLLQGAMNGGAAELGSHYTITAEYDASVGVRFLADVSR